MNTKVGKFVAGAMLTVLGVVLSWALLRAILTRPAIAPPERGPRAPLLRRQLMYFGASGCRPCRQMEGTLKDAKVAAALDGYDLKLLDVDRDRALAAKHGVIAIPTYLLLDPAGKELRRGSGYKSPAAFLAWLEGG